MKSKNFLSGTVLVRSYLRMRSGVAQLVRKHVRSQQSAQLDLPLAADRCTDAIHTTGMPSGCLPMTAASATPVSDSPSAALQPSDDIPAVHRADRASGWGPMSPQMRADLKRLMEGGSGLDPEAEIGDETQKP